MPTYEYACTACGAHSEVVQKFTDSPLTKCEACGGRLRKVFSPVGIVFKGPGFYRTDSRAPTKEPATAGQHANGSEPGKKAAGDAAPAAASSKEPSAGGSSTGGSASGDGSSPGSGPSSGGSSAGKPSSTKVA